MPFDFQKLKQIVADEITGLSDPTHDMDHILRVHNLALHLAEQIPEPVDREILEIATLLHDIAEAKEQADPSGRTDHAVLGAQRAGEILAGFNYPPERIKRVQECIISHRYRTENLPQSIEAKILFDADKLDAIGAIGVAREFTWVGKNNAHIYRRVEKIQDYLDENMGGKINGRIRDKTKHSPQIEQEIKVSRLIDKLQTAEARKIARERLEYHRSFLDRLEREVRGEL